MNEPIQQQFSFSVDAEVGKGQYADTVNITSDENNVCLTFAVREPLQPAGQPSMLCIATSRMYIPWELAKFIARSLSEANVKKNIHEYSSVPEEQT